PATVGRPYGATSPITRRAAMEDPILVVVYERGPVRRRRTPSAPVSQTGAGADGSGCGRDLPGLGRPPARKARRWLDTSPPPRWLRDADARSPWPESYCAPHSR